MNRQIKHVFPDPIEPGSPGDQEQLHLYGDQAVAARELINTLRKSAGSLRPSTTGDMVRKAADLSAENEQLKQRIELLELQLHMAEDTTVWHAAATLAPPGCPLLVRRSDGEVVEAIRPEYVRDRNPETPMGYFLLGDCKSEIHDPVEWAHR